MGRRASGAPARSHATRTPIPTASYAMGLVAWARLQSSRSITAAYIHIYTRSFFFVAIAGPIQFKFPLPRPDGRTRAPAAGRRDWVLTLVRFYFERLFVGTGWQFVASQLTRTALELCVALRCGVVYGTTPLRLRVDAAGGAHPLNCCSVVFGLTMGRLGLLHLMHTKTCLNSHRADLERTTSNAGHVIRPHSEISTLTRRPSFADVLSRSRTCALS